MFALAEMLTPALFIRWRSWMIEGSTTPLREVGGAFDKLLATGGSEPWKNPEAQRRVRRLGMVLLLAGLPLMVLETLGLDAAGIA